MSGKPIFWQVLRSESLKDDILKIYAKNLLQSFKSRHKNLSVLTKPEPNRL